MKMMKPKFATLIAAAVLTLGSLAAYAGDIKTVLITGTDPFKYDIPAGKALTVLTYVQSGGSGGLSDLTVKLADGTSAVIRRATNLANETSDVGSGTTIIAGPAKIIVGALVNNEKVVFTYQVSAN